MSEPGQREPDADRESVRPSGTNWADLAKVAGVIGANVTIFSALLIGFGWAKADAESQVLGFHERLRGLSTQYYLLSSIGTVAEALVVMVVGGLVLLWLDGRISRRVRDRGLGPFGQVVLGFLVLSVIVLPGVVWLLQGSIPIVYPIAFPIALGLGLGISFYAVYLRYGARATTWRWRVAKVLTVSLVAVTAFWAVLSVARFQGSQAAVKLERSLQALPMVVVFSPERLHLSLPPEHEMPLVDPDSDEAATAKFRYRYSGLRFLEYGGGKFFLLPEGWTTAVGVVIILPDDGRTRLEFVRLAT